jgi:uncharacterized protein YhhL (DUF1145 family)
MTTTTVRAVEDEPGAAYLWTVSLAGIAFWTTHVLVEVSLVPFSQHHHWMVWCMHGFTVLLATLTLIAVLLSWRIAHRAASPEDHTSPAGRTAFLGWFGMFSNIANFVLIVTEGVYIAVLWIHA